MSLAEFSKLIEKGQSTFDDPILKSLALIKEGQWEDSHNIAQDIENKWGYLVHGYLHRIEGDRWNASYWYRRAEEKDFIGSLDEEWNFIAYKYLSTLTS